MKYIVTKVDTKQGATIDTIGWTTINGIFDSYIGARRSFRGFNVRGKRVMEEALLRKWPHMTREVFMLQFVSRRIKNHQLNVPIAVFTASDGRDIITIHACNVL